MERHYNAFISYRHAAVDSKIAKEIQQQLERFRIPGAIARQTGIKKIDRIFRDKEELPITSDLNEDIAEALANSDYLIVICSPRTGESMWVQKEIETFLGSHSRNQVLTVLAEGEPGDVIPEILLTDRVLDEETGEETAVPVEPLSCDYRLPLRQARREELPRLAATILGCGYDDLRQRQRMYQMRRLLALMAVILTLALGMTAYFIWSNGQIRENYSLALRNQSVYLSAESRKYLESGDWITAVQLAMAAMPGEDSERPATPEAELALSRAVGAYSYGSAWIDSVLLEGRYPEDIRINDLWVDESRSFLVTIDAQPMVKVWDAARYSVLWQKRLSSFYSAEGLSDIYVILLPEQRLLLRDKQVFTCYSLSDGETLWSYQRDEALAFAEDYLLLPEQEELLLLFQDHLVSLDTMTGQERWTCDYPGYPDATEENMDGYDLSFLPGHSVSPDGDAVLLTVRVSDSYDARRYGMVLDLGTRSWQPLQTTYDEILGGCMTDRQTAVIMGFPEDDDDSRPRSFYSEFFNREGTAAVCCERAGASAPLWTSELVYYVGSLREAVRPCGDGTILCAIANLFVRLDPETGAEVSRAEASAPVVEDIFESDHSQMSVLSDGSRSFYTTDDDECSCVPHFDAGVKRVKMTLEPDPYGDPQMHFFVLQDSSDMVLRYVSGGTVMDEGYQMLGWSLSAPSAVAEAGDYLVLGNYHEICCMDRTSGGLQWRLGEDLVEAHEDYQTLQLLGVSADGTTAAVSLSYDGGLLGTVEIATGALTEHRLEDADGALWELAYYSDALCMLGDLVCGVQIAPGDGGKELRTYHVLTGEKHTYPLGDLASGVLSAAGDRLLFRMTGKDGIPQSWYLDPETGEKTEMERSGEWNKAPAAREDGYLAMLDGSDVILLDPEGRLERVIETEVPCDALAFVPGLDALLLLGSNRQVYVYGLEGNRQTVIDLEQDESALYPNVRWQFDGGKCVLYLDGRAHLIDLETWTLELMVDLCFRVEGDRFYCRRPDENGETVAAYYTRYTPEELMEKGRERIGGQTLRDPEKYGLK